MAVMGTNKNKFGTNIYPGYAFVAPNEAFDAPIMEIPTFDENGEPDGGTEFVSIRDYYRLEVVDSVFTNRKVMPLAGGTHSFGMFDMSHAKGEFTKNSNLIKDNGLRDCGDDFTLSDLDSAYILSYGELVEFLEVSPLNVAPVVEGEPE